MSTYAMPWIRLDALSYPFDSSARVKPAHILPWTKRICECLISHPVVSSITHCKFYLFKIMLVRLKHVSRRPDHQSWRDGRSSLSSRILSSSSLSSVSFSMSSSSSSAISSTRRQDSRIRSGTEWMKPRTFPKLFPKKSPKESPAAPRNGPVHHDSQMAPKPLPHFHEALLYPESCRISL